MEMIIIVIITIKTTTEFTSLLKASYRLAFTYVAPFILI